MAETETGNINPQAVEPQTDGNATETQTDDEKPTFTKTKVNTLITERLSRQQKQHEAEIAKLKEKIKTPEYDTKEQEFKAKIKELQDEIKTRDTRVSEYRQKTIEKTVASALSSKGCLDSDLLAAQILASGKVKYQEDTGEIVVEDLTGEVSVDQLVEEYITKKPYLFQSKTSGGIGTTAPRKIGANPLTKDDELLMKMREAGFKVGEKKSRLTPRELIAARKENR